MWSLSSEGGGEGLNGRATKKRTLFFAVSLTGNQFQLSGSTLTEILVKINIDSKLLKIG